MKASFVGKDQKDGSVTEQVLKGEFELVFMSPECMLRVLKYWQMFRSVTCPQKSDVLGHRRSSLCGEMVNVQCLYGNVSPHLYAFRL